MFVNTNKMTTYNIHWKIVNFSYLWHAKGDKIDSPLLSLNGLDETKWKLRLYPRGGTSGNYIAYFLRRELEDTGPDHMELTFELSLHSPTVCNPSGFLFTEPFTKDRAWGKHEMEKREEIFGTEKEKFLKADDTLTAFCSLRKSIELKTEQTVSVYARTIVKVEKRTFVWNIDRFSLIEPRQRRRFVVGSSPEEHLVNLELFLTGQCCEEIINIDISSNDPAIKYLTFKSFILDGMGEKLDCGHQEIHADDLAEGLTFNLLVKKRKLIEKKDIYLPKDVLSLHCECAFTTGIAFEGIERTHVGVSSSEASHRVVESSQPYPSDELRMALKAIHDEGLFSDMQIEIAKETLPVHKSILAARSPIFKTMFEKGMKNSQECVCISDLDKDTIHRMVLYLYTDTLNDLSWENALKLYVAADKYRIVALKNECASFVKDNLTTENVCKILILVNMFQDKDLKNDLQDYVLKRDKEIFCSKNWKNLMDTHPKLAAETMCLKYFKE